MGVDLKAFPFANEHEYVRPPPPIRLILGPAAWADLCESCSTLPPPVHVSWQNEPGGVCTTIQEDKVKRDKRGPINPHP